MIGYKEKIEQTKAAIRDSGYEQFKNYTYRDNKLIGTLYIKEKMDYGFHIYYIHEPSNTDSLAGKIGTLSEMYYDLRNKIYWIKRNLKEVKFSVRNVDSIFPYSEKEEMFNRLSTANNQGLYNSAFKFLGAMGEEKTSMFGRFFHRLITEHSYYEILYKANIKINGDTPIINKEGKSPKEILGLSKTQWKMISKFGVKPSKFEKLDNNEADTVMINYLNYVKSLDEEFGLDKTIEFFENEFDYVYGRYAYRSSLELAKLYDLPERNFIRYIYFECDVSQGLSASIAISQYRDYIRMTKEMGYERFDRYPKFLRTAHDIASRNYRIKLNEREVQEWNKAYETNKSFEYQYRNYKIFPPKEPSDLVREGNVLGHCVGSYINNVRKGLTTILFLREKEDIECPLITIEVKNNRIAQAKGKMNNPPSKELKSIIEKFAAKYELAY